MVDSSERREGYPFRVELPTRWSDNDMYGHVNNAVYSTFFEATVVRFILDEVRLDWQAATVVPFAVEVLCCFHWPLRFPDVVEAGLRIVQLGNSSVTYELALFSGERPDPAASGRFVQVYVDRRTERPTTIPAPVRAVYEAYLAA